MSEPSWIDNISNAGIRADLLALTVDGTLSYQGAVQLFEDVAKQGDVTATEFSDLQTIVSNLGLQKSSSPYLVSVLAQLVNGSPANATWTGGAEETVALGNLHVGSSSQQVTELIDKWLLGTDLPNAMVPAEFDGLKNAQIDPVYKAFNLPLFDAATGLPTFSDVRQGMAGDCEVCAVMIDMVNNHINDLGSMIRDNGNGTYGVRFYVGGRETWVTVDNELPTTATQSTVFAHTDPVKGDLWVTLVEKAYVQLSATGQLAHPAENSYGNINGNGAWFVLMTFTNGTGHYYMSSDNSWTSYKQTFIDALAAGDDLILDSEGETADASGKTELVASHAFAVVGYDGATGNFIVRNPWGAPNGATWVPQFEVSMETIASVKGDICVDDTGGRPVTYYSPIGAIAAYQSGTINHATHIVASASDIIDELSGLQAMAAAGKLPAIQLADGAATVVNVSDSQLSTYAKVWVDISGNYTLVSPDATDVVAKFIVQQDAVRSSADSLEVAGVSTTGGTNSVIGFQSADLPGHAHNAIVLAGMRSQYGVVLDNSGGLTITASAATEDAAAGRSVHVTGASYVVFAGEAGGPDILYVPGNAGDAAVATLYQSTFGRLPDLPGLEAWEKQYDNGAMSLADISRAFLTSAEFSARYGAVATLNDKTFVSDMYANVLGRTPDQDGLGAWANYLTTIEAAKGNTADGNLSCRATVLYDFCTSGEEASHSAGWLAAVGGGGAAAGQADVVSLIGVPHAA